MLSEGTSKETVGTGSQGKKLQALAVNEDHHFFSEKEAESIAFRKTTDRFVDHDKFELSSKN